MIPTAMALRQFVHLGSWKSEFFNKVSANTSTLTQSILN